MITADVTQSTKHDAGKVRVDPLPDHTIKIVLFPPGSFLSLPCLDQVVTAMVFQPLTLTEVRQQMVQRFADQ